jgi:hypothetical protein
MGLDGRISHWNLSHRSHTKLATAEIHRSGFHWSSSQFRWCSTAAELRHLRPLLAPFCTKPSLPQLCFAPRRKNWHVGDDIDTDRFQQHQATLSGAGVWWSMRRVGRGTVLVVSGGVTADVAGWRGRMAVWVGEPKLYSPRSRLSIFSPLHGRLL